MGIVQRIEESKAAAKQLKQEEDQTALIAALEAEMAEENSGVDEVPDPALEVNPALVSDEETEPVIQPEPEVAPEPEVLPEPEAAPASKSKGKKS